jgi:hypothetical protein
LESLTTFHLWKAAEKERYLSSIVTVLIPKRDLVHYGIQFGAVLPVGEFLPDGRTPIL